MLSSPSPALQCRGIFLRLPLRHSSPQPSCSPTRYHFRRFYGRMLRTVISKHVSSFKDSIRPILPLPPLRFPSQTPTQTPPARPAAETWTSYSSQGTPANAVIIDEDTTNDVPVVADDIRDTVRLLMRRVPHPVAIITSTDPNAPADTAFRGMTVSSFNTVTLHPHPIVSFNVKLPSETYNAVRNSSRFLVHLLSPKETTARLAWEFAKGNENIMQAERDEYFHYLSASNPESQPSIRDGEPPRLAINAPSNMAPSSETELPDFPFIFECKYLPQSVSVGDHVIMLGTVVNVFRQGPSVPCDDNDTHTGDELCLTYADTRFWKMGDNVTFSTRRSS